MINFFLWTCFLRDFIILKNVVIVKLFHVRSRLQDFRIFTYLKTILMHYTIIVGKKCRGVALHTITKFKSNNSSIWASIWWLNCHISRRFREICRVRGFTSLLLHGFQ